MFQLMLGKWILKHGAIKAFLIFGDLLVKVTKTKEDDKMWKKVRPIIKNFK